MNSNFKNGFTLVELIVVITILAILATVGFISISQYSQNSRDSVRLSDLKSIAKAFEIQKGKNNLLPLPDKKVDVISQGEIFQYQGILSDKILKSIDIHGGGKDPQTQEYFGYVVNKQQNKFQLITFLENPDDVISYGSFPQTYANNLSKTPKTIGDVLGIVLDDSTKEVIKNTNTPLDLDTEFTNKNMVFHNALIVETPEEMNHFDKVLNGVEASSCKELLENNTELLGQDGYYFLNTKGVLKNTYCDMTTNGGGWDVHWFTGTPKTFSCESWSPDGKTFSTCWNTYGHLTWNKFLDTGSYIISSEMRNTNTHNHCQSSLWASQNVSLDQQVYSNSYTVGTQDVSVPYEFELTQAGEYEITYYLDGGEYRIGECDDNIRVSNMTLKFKPN